MATLYISEFSGGSSIGTSQAQFLPQPAVAGQTVAIGGSSAKSVAFNARTYVVMLSTDAICSVKFGGSAVAATATDLRLPANSTAVFSVQPGSYVAVITNS